MAKDQREQSYRVKKKRKKIGFWTKVVVLVIGGYFIMSFFQQSVEKRELDAQMDSLLKEQQQIEARIEGLQRILDKGDTDESIEKLARENLTMKKPGERIYILDTTNTLNRDLLERQNTEQDEEEEEESDENGEE